MKSFLSLLFIPVLAFAQVSNRPNVVLMMADDMGIGDTSAYQFFTGNEDGEQLYTPQMERLANMGILFTDGHTPSSRCTATRYGLLTGRYAFRNRMKYWVLFGVQGDPLIESDRPTLATLFKSKGYSTAMVGKWHVGLRYSRKDGKPAAEWRDADLSKPLAVSPVDHGFDFARYTSRSHGTSGPAVDRIGKNKRGNRNTPDQSIGPGHLHGRRSVSANGNGKQLHDKGQNAYALHKLGSRHSNNALDFLNNHLSDQKSRSSPFFLYYACSSNHGPYTPDKSIGGEPVAGAGRLKSGVKSKVRGDYIYENDVALGRLLDYLENTEDPRRSGKKLLANTLVVFTSDNGAEITAKTATGPFRSNKGSAYEGGHRVPFIVAWPDGKIGDGDASTPGRKSKQLVSLQDWFATFSDILGKPLPDLRNGQKGGEDSFSILPALLGKNIPHRPLFHNDHKETADNAACALRLDDPEVNNELFPGQWKLLFDGPFIRYGEVKPLALFNLAADPKERANQLLVPELKPLINYLSKQAIIHRNSGGHRMAELADGKQRVVFDWTVSDSEPSLSVHVTTENGEPHQSEDGLGIKGGESTSVDAGEALLLRFEKDVLIEYAAIRAGEGSCGGFYRMGKSAPLAIYCVDADNDSKEQHSHLSDLGVLRAGEALRLDSSPHYVTEPAGSWHLQKLAVRLLE